MRRYTCGVAREQCSGGTSITNAGLGKFTGAKVHASPEEAFACKRRSLIAEGWEQIGSKEFRPPQGVNDGYILVLTKPSHFGGVLRKGKTGEKGQKGRVMPKSGRAGYIA